MGNPDKNYGEKYFPLPYFFPVHNKCFVFFVIIGKTIALRVQVCYILDIWG